MVDILDKGAALAIPPATATDAAFHPQYGKTKLTVTNKANFEQGESHGSAAAG